MPVIGIGSKLKPLVVPANIQDVVGILQEHITAHEAQLAKHYQQVDKFKADIASTEGEKMRRDRKDALKETLESLVEFQYGHIRALKSVISELNILVARMKGEYTNFEVFCAETPVAPPEFIKMLKDEHK